jgi:ribosomal protein S27AE
MPKNVECESCGTTLLSFESTGPTPIDHEECPNCGGDSFEFVG